MRTAEEALSPPSIFDTLRLLANGQRGGDSQVDLEPPPAKRTKPSTDDISKPIFLPVTPAKRPQSLVQVLFKNYEDCFLEAETVVKCVIQNDICKSLT